MRTCVCFCVSGGFGLDEGCRLWLRSTTHASHALRGSDWNVAEVMPEVPKRGSYLKRFEDAKRAELQAAYDLNMMDAPKTGIAAVFDKGVNVVARARSATSTLATMLKGRAQKSVMLQRIRSLKDAPSKFATSLRDTAIAALSHSSLLRQQDDLMSESGKASDSNSDTDDSNMLDALSDDLDSGITSSDSESSSLSTSDMDSQSTDKGSDSSGRD